MDFDQAKSLINRSTRVVGFTGAGISTESGIPDFRSLGGIWATSRMVTYDEFIHDHESRAEQWRQKAVMWPEMRKAEPNPGHRAFVELERQGRLLALITQNIDGLHQKAGSTEVIELHGTTAYAECLTCQARITMDEAIQMVAAGNSAPECKKCGGYLKPATVLFGQALPEQQFVLAVEACRECEVMIAAGSSLSVYPAAALPQLAKQSGAALIIINRTPTPCDEMADLVIYDEIGQSLPALVGQG